MPEGLTPEQNQEAKELHEKQDEFDTEAGYLESGASDLRDMRGDILSRGVKGIDAHATATQEELDDIDRDIKENDQNLERAEDKRDANLWRSQQHFREHEAGYKQQVVKEATEAGVDVSYPLDTNTTASQPRPESPPDRP